MLWTHVLEGGQDDKDLEGEQLGQRVAADHVVLESALEADHGEDGRDGGDELEGLELQRGSWSVFGGSWRRNSTGLDVPRCEQTSACWMSRSRRRWLQ